MTTATSMADGSSSSGSSQVETEQVRCWKVQSGLNSALVQVLSTFTGASCAVSANLPLVSTRFAPNETIPVFWTVRLLTEAQTTNDLQMKNPPVAAPTLAADHVGQSVQIAATNVRVCASRSLCDPTIASIANSTLQSGNFSTTGNTVPFQSLNQLSVAVEGSYVLAAQVRVVDDEDPTISYYYAAFSDITVATEKEATVIYDKRTTYCRRSAQSALATTLLVSSSIERSSSCELQVVVNSTDVTQPNTSLAVSWTANLTRDSTKELRFPTPLTTVDVNFDRKYYEIVSSTIRVCKESIQCDEYSADDSGEIETSTGAAILYGNFSADGIAGFTLTDIKLPATGIYGAFAHLVLAAPNSRRFDTVTYFQIVVAEEDVGAQVSKEQYESGSSYCWEVVGAANATSTAATTSVMAMAKNSECPYTVEMALSTSSSISVTDSVNVSWKVKQQSAYSESKFSNGVTITTVHDTATNSFVNLPQLAVYYCNKSLCTPFSTQKQLAFAASATNFTAGEASFTSSNFMFPAAGNYTLFVHTVVPNGDNFRFDAAAFAKVSVVAPIVISDDKSGSNVGTILGIVAGCIGGALLILFAVVATRRYLTKRRRAPITKAAVFGFRSHTLDSPERGDMPTASRESGSDASMSFMYVKAAPSPIEDVRANSLSYDPYSRPSFNDLSMDDANYTFALPEGELEEPTSEPTSEPPVQQQTHRF